MASTLESLPRAVEWNGSALVVIDQTALPARLELVELRDVDAVVDAIRRLVVRGAPTIGVVGAYGLVLGLRGAGPRTRDEARRALDELAERIGSARPTAVNLRWALERVRTAALSHEDPAEMLAAALDEAVAIQRRDEEACRRIGEAGRDLLGGARTILTHCNAGRLATAGAGTALGIVYSMAEAGRAPRVYATETRPLLQGARLTAWELSQAGIDVTLIPDSGAGYLLASGEVDAVVVGCDRVAANGDVANKVGTYPLAVLANRHGVPFVVAGPTSSVDLATADGQAIEIELRGAEELQPPDGVAVLNPAFDVTPAELVSAIVTERGVARPPYELSLRAVAEAGG